METHDGTISYRKFFQPLCAAIASGRPPIEAVDSLVRAGYGMGDALEFVDYVCKAVGYRRPGALWGQRRARRG